MKRFVSVIGPNKTKCSEELYLFGIDLGKYLIDLHWGIVCGGKFGFMETVCKGARLSTEYDGFSTIGIIPELEKDEANDYCDFVLPTGLSFTRNFLVINASDYVIAAGGGAGTLSEISFAWQLKKTILCFSQYGGWSEKLAGVRIDNTCSNCILDLKELQDLKKYLPE